MDKFAWVLALLIGLAYITCSSQYVASPTCFGQTCPSPTTSCKEHKESIRGKQIIQIKISCLDAEDASVKDYYFEEPSHFDPYTSYRNTKYESINEGISHLYRNEPLDLTPHYL